MTPEELMTKLQACHRKWRRDAEQGIHKGLNYLLIRDIGCDLVRWTRNNKKSVALAKKVFAILEEALENPSQEIINLVGAGFVEDTQSYLYHTSTDFDPDFFSAYMPPKLLKLWEDIIEGWIGDGIRTIKAWKALGD